MVERIDSIVAPTGEDLGSGYALGEGFFLVDTHPFGQGLLMLVLIERRLEAGYSSVMITREFAGEILEGGHLVSIVKERLLYDVKMALALMRTAADLLDALEGLRGSSRCFCRPSFGKGFTEVHSATCINALAAISKAKGGTA